MNCFKHLLESEYCIIIYIMNNITHHWVNRQFTLLPTDWIMISVRRSVHTWNWDVDFILFIFLWVFTVHLSTYKHCQFSIEFHSLFTLSFVYMNIFITYCLFICLSLHCNEILFVYIFVSCLYVNAQVFLSFYINLSMI